MNRFPKQTICPTKFVSHTFTKDFIVERPLDATWWWLMQPETFQDAQLWPWRVEFIDTPLEDGMVARGFDVGTLNAHHGPFMNFCGVIAAVDESAELCSRRLDYSYGAFAIGFRFIRPVSLEISCRKNLDSTTTVTVQIVSYVSSWIARPWTLAQKLFWPGFGFVMRRKVPTVKPASI